MPGQLSAVDDGIVQLQGGTDNTVIGNLADQMRLVDIVNTAGQFRAQTVTNSAAAAQGAASVLTNRKSLWITPTTGTIYWGTSNAVTTATGSPIFNNQTMQFSVGPGITIYVIAVGSVNCRMVEMS